MPAAVFATILKTGISSLWYNKDTFETEKKLVQSILLNKKTIQRDRLYRCKIDQRILYYDGNIWPTYQLIIRI